MQGIDIRCNGDAVLATREQREGGIGWNQNKNTPGGKSLTVEYTRTDGSKVQCTYMHLKEVTVKVGDVVQAGGSSAHRATQVHVQRVNIYISALTNSCRRNKA